jgi:hypothetical protein
MPPRPLRLAWLSLALLSLAACDSPTAAQVPLLQTDAPAYILEPVGIGARPGHRCSPSA